MSYYTYIVGKRGDSDELKQVMESTVDQLIDRDTDPDHPGMLLGLIQSGKTRAFVGVMARGFDMAYDVCVVFTKSSSALVSQTVKRIRSEFEIPVQRDHLHVYDIMSLPPLTAFILGKKLVFVVKKETRNLDRLDKTFFTTYPELGTKNVLIIDDEADFASVTYHPNKKASSGVDFGKLAQKISAFRERLGAGSDYLQVTATPYSLYLQPHEIEVNSMGYEPLRPAFTEVLHPHPYYVGGKVYFEDSQDPQHYASHLFIHVASSEFQNLIVSKSRRKPDARYLKSIHKTDEFKGYREAFINYLVAGSIRDIQERTDESVIDPWQENYKSACLIHVHTKQDSHQWQFELVNALILRLKEMEVDDTAALDALIQMSYNGFKDSIHKAGLSIPDFTQVLDRVKQALVDGEIGVKQVNSENSVIDLLNDSGQLRLDNPFNVFIGGQVLDRGITIDNLIAFYYGRSPGRFQMDTVLQHSRMYGARKKADVAVTRFYTSSRIYEAMKEMHEFDTALRKSCLSGERVRFVQRSSNGTVRPCSPNKVALSSLVTIRPGSRHLPIGFQTKSASSIGPLTESIDTWIEEHGGEEAECGWLESVGEVESILEVIHDTFTYSDRFSNNDMEWDIDAFKDALRYMLDGKSQLHVIARSNRNVSRLKNAGASYTDAPDDGRLDLGPARRLAVNLPVLMLIRQNGEKDKGWRGAPFYWPVLIAPKSIQTSIYSEE